MFGLATYHHLPKSGIQGRKGGDFSAQRFEKYYLALVWRIAF
jgi:hypothetical protein